MTPYRQVQYLCAEGCAEVPGHRGVRPQGEAEPLGGSFSVHDGHDTIRRKWLNCTSSPAPWTPARARWPCTPTTTTPLGAASDAAAPPTTEPVRQSCRAVSGARTTPWRS